MKLLFTGPLKDFSGFAHASRLLLKSVYLGGIDVVARTITYDKLDSGQKIDIEPWMEECLGKDITKDVDVSLQMTTCNIEANIVSGVMNILYSFFETDRIPNSWAAKANEFDMLMVPCKENADALMRSGVNKPILICPIPCDGGRFEADIEPYDLGDKAEGRTIFYNICQLSQKKGIDLLLRSYFAAFADRPDEVLLVLKTYIGMGDRKNEIEYVKRYIENVWTSTRIPGVRPPILPILRTFTEEEIDSLHCRGDMYVNSSRGEGYAIPLFDAMAFGNIALTNTWGGPEVFASDKNALIYGGCMTHCYGQDHPDPDLYNGLSQWFEPSTAEMGNLMRSYHLLKQMSDSGNISDDNKRSWDNILQRKVEAAKLRKSFDAGEIKNKICDQINDAFDKFKELMRKNDV